MRRRPTGRRAGLWVSSAVAVALSPGSSLAANAIPCEWTVNWSVSPDRIYAPLGDKTTIAGTVDAGHPSPALAR